MADVKVLIIGGGFSGLCMAVKLLHAGISSFVLIEKYAELGGTWFLNRYPGCRCDIPSHFYSYSFDRNPHWSSMYADRSEIHQYIKDCAIRHGVLPHVRFNTVVTAAIWDAAESVWHVKMEESVADKSHDVDHPPSSVTSTIKAQFVVRAVGPFHAPQYPEIKGMEKFKGPAFHSSYWDASVDFAGKTVAVMGTGASSIQIVPSIAPIVKKLYVFQRTPAWISPKPTNWSFSKRCRQLFAHFPLLMCLFSWFIFWMHEIIIWGVLRRKWIRRVAEWVVMRNIQGAIKDPALIEKVKPKYEMGCNRILLSNDFYPALARPNVEVMTHPILEVRENALLVSDGPAGVRPLPVDAIVYATGFQLVTKLPVVGANGLEFTQAGYSSILGITKQGFPNFFTLFGYNTGVAQTSQILTIEAQARYVVSCIGLVGGPSRSLEPLEVSERRHQEFLARRFPKLVWSFGGCSSFYLDKSTGHNFTLWPASTLEYIYRTWSANRRDYHIR
ncbi:hypothetical protein GOP47_0024858 [Adiantum capillus-veneris]|uniref:Flavin-containing monooxygenase n=1 Tax=Adiantum capillus-veneris TaxID=13818 RepID=A0A9D4U3S2_ADICA|nr:hypothetical protein GOP47_0024858 [Adiantum capillus-veneris]